MGRGSGVAKVRTRSLPFKKCLRGGRQAGVRDHTTDPLKAEVKLKPRARTTSTRAWRVDGSAPDLAGPALACSESPTAAYLELGIIKETGRWKHASRWKQSLDNAACPAGSSLRHVAPRKRVVSGSVGVALRLKELVELCVEIHGPRAIRALHARNEGPAACSV